MGVYEVYPVRRQEVVHPSIGAFQKMLSRMMGSFLTDMLYITCEASSDLSAQRLRVAGSNSIIIDRPTPSRAHAATDP